MTHSRILLNDGTSAVLLNDGTSFVLLNAEGPPDAAGITLEGNHGRFVDFRDFKAEKEEILITIKVIGAIRLTSGVIAESIIKRIETFGTKCRIEAESTVIGLSKIYRNILHEVKGRTTREAKIFEVTGFNKSQHLSNHHKILLNEHDNKKERTQKVSEIKKLYDEYKEGIE